MLATRGLQLAVRRAVLNPASASRLAPATLRIQSRFAATQNVPLDHSQDLLRAQRLNRPVSPHLTIYQPQITWYLSSVHRITGFILSGGTYAFAAAYLVAPAFGWHLETASLVAAFGGLPLLVKAGIKTCLALPFTFHSFNGVRHLIWDVGMGFTNKQVQITGWAVLGLTAVSSLWIGLFL